jgi:hypothetical protein
MPCIPGLSVVWLFLAVAVLMQACGPRDKSPKQRTIKDVENAIQVISERKVSEELLIIEQKRQIEILKENKAQSKSIGMKNKIQKDIEIKILAIEKAKTNIANQEVILGQLQVTKDSLRGVEVRE